MRRTYLKKNFLSDNIVKNINEYVSKQELKNIYILLIIFLIILPVTINSISASNVKVKNCITNKNKGININKIKGCMELFGDGISGSFNKNQCIIKTASEKLILDISQNNKYAIENINKDNDDLYIIKVKENG